LRVIEFRDVCRQLDDSVTSVERTRFVFVTALIGALTLVAAACGGSSHRANSAVVTATTAAPAATTVAVPAGASTRPTRTAPKATTTKNGSTSPTTTHKSSALGVVAAVPPGGAAPADVSIASAGAPGHSSSPTTVKPFDPSQQIDLSGTPGVTAEQQHAAEALLRDTLRDLPRFASQSGAYAAGYRTIGDASTGDEHWVNWAYAKDSDILDSQHPESLVYDTRTPGHPVLEAAMYMLPPGSKWTDIPLVYRNALMQFHVHNNICFAQTSDPLQMVFAGLRNGDGDCPPGTTLAGNVPMIHAWIVKNPCGPFAALSGIAAGQVPAGQTPNCDTAHAGVL
jgi:hypothetical protein